MGAFERYLRSEKGVISIFLSGVLLLTSMASAVMMDYARMEALRGDLEAALRTTSHVILSEFHKPMAHEFGLFAIRDPETIETEGEEILSRRLEEQGFHSFRGQSPKIKIDILPEARLSKPDQLARQIDQFMEWQLPQAVLARAMEHIALLKNLRAAIAPLEAKLKVEESLQAVQDRLNAAGKSFQQVAALPLPQGLTALPAKTTAPKGVVFTGIPPIEPLSKEIDQEQRALDHLLEQALQKGIEKQKGEQATISASLLASEDRRKMRSTFLKIQQKHRSVGHWFQQWKKAAEATKGKMEQASAAVTALEGANQSWKQKLDALPKGNLSQQMIGDYLAYMAQQKTKGWTALTKDMEQVTRQAIEIEKEWNAATWTDTALSTLTFDHWLNHRLDALQKRGQTWVLPAAPIHQYRSPRWSSGLSMQEESQKTQKALWQQGSGDRSGLLEFIRAWGKKQRAISNARRATAAGLPRLAGGIGDYLSEEVLGRYRADGADMVRNSYQQVEPGSEKSMIGGVFHALHRIAEEVGGTADTAVETLRLITYWTGMFSHRLSQKDLEREGSLLSLNGLPLQDRSVFGGELEYILMGRQQWMDNIEQVVLRISAIRLLCNMIYAFSSSELYLETSQIAFALAGWTGFAVPFVQSALIMLLAIGETKLDIDALVTGERVAIFKTAATWRFSLSGVGKLVKGAASDLLDRAGLEVQSGIAAGGEMAKESIQSIQTNLKEALRDAVEHPLMRLMEGFVSRVQEVPAQELQNELGAALGALQARSGSGQIGQAAFAAFGHLQGQTSRLTHLIMKAREEKERAGKETQAVLSHLKSGVSGIIDGVVESANGAIDKAGARLEKEVSNIRKKGGALVDQKIDQAFEAFRSEVGAQGATATPASGLSMSYGDYIVLLVCLTTATRSGRDAMLTHTAALIQAETKGPDLTMTSSAIHLDVEAGLSTLFLHAFSPEAHDGRTKIQATWTEGYGARPLAEGGP